MRKTLSSVAMAVLLTTAAAFAAERSWTGKISDSMCGRSHKATIQHGKKKMTDAECAKACVKDGAKYVFVAGPKIYEIANQDFAGLEAHAGHIVRLTGELSGDSITVSKIQMPARKK